MLNFDFPQKCTTCQGYKTMPYAWSSTVQPQMCTCPKVSLSWECHRCGKINAPWKGSCDCTPPNNSFPFGAPIECKVPTSTTQPYTAGPNPFDHYYNDPPGPRQSSHDLNKNFTDK